MSEELRDPSYRIPQNLYFDVRMDFDLKRISELTGIKTNDLIRQWIQEKILWYKLKFKVIWEPPKKRV